MPRAPRTRLVILFGGRSAEHEVSCVSAASVLRAVDWERFHVDLVGIDPTGAWVRARETDGPLAAKGEPVDPFHVLAGPDTVVFPLVHGPLGEDGTLQGLLELAEVPYIGSGVLGSALAMHKAAAKEVLAAAGLPQVPWLALRHHETDGAAGQVDAAFGWPVFVKPANMGSSVGVSRVAGPDDLGEALALALAYDDTVVVEEAVRAREVECAVLGNEAPETSPLGEIVPSREFYDYDDKYSGDGAQLVVPAALPTAVVDRGRALAAEAFTALRCEGMARVDFFYEEDGRGLLVNEVNTIPGFTPYSMYPQLWQAAGVPYGALVDRLVALALARHERRRGRTGRSRHG